MCKQAIFRLDPDGTFTTLHSFGDAHPSTLILGNNGNLYGATSWGQGTIFRLDSDGTFTTLHSFDGSDGSNPNTLIEGSEGKLYGTTSMGGGSDWGTIFRLDPDGTFITLHSFDGPVPDGMYPNTLILGSDGNLYGKTFGGQGMIFRLDPDGTFTTLHSFDGPNSSNPNSLIEGSDGSLYGTTSRGGASDRGTIFRLRLPPPALQLPGDCNQDGSRDVSDAICLFGFLFLGVPAALPCGDGSGIHPGNLGLIDWQPDGRIDISDGIAFLEYFFIGGPAHALGTECQAIPGCPMACDP